jgi:hypothetical protein
MNDREKVKKMLDDNGKITPYFVANKLKINLDVARQLCDEAYADRCREYFFIRNFGMSRKDFFG